MFDYWNFVMKVFIIKLYLFVCLSYITNMFNLHWYIIQIQQKLVNFVQNQPHKELAVAIINNEQPSVMPRLTPHHLLDVIQHLRIAMATRIEPSVLLQNLFDLMQKPQTMTVIFKYNLSDFYVISYVILLGVVTNIWGDSKTGRRLEVISLQFT